MENIDEILESITDAKTIRICKQVHGIRYGRERGRREWAYFTKFINDPNWTSTECIRRLRKTFTWRLLRASVGIQLGLQGWRLPSSLVDRITDFFIVPCFVEARARAFSKILRTPGTVDTRGMTISHFVRNRNKRIRYLARIEALAKSLGETGILQEVERVRQRERLTRDCKPLSICILRKALCRIPALAQALTMPENSRGGRRRRREVAVFRKAALSELESWGVNRSEASRIIAELEVSHGLSKLTISADAYGTRRKVDAILRQIRQ